MSYKVELVEKKDVTEQLKASKSSIKDLFKKFLRNTFQEILYKISNQINEGSGWIIELSECQYINISAYRPLSGGSYVELPVELRSSKKGLINMKNDNQRCFLWCHVRHINPVKIHPERITEN